MSGEIKAGDVVLYVPYHARGNILHPACEQGLVVRVSESGDAFVLFGFGSVTPKLCKAENLVKFEGGAQ